MTTQSQAVVKRLDLPPAPLATIEQLREVYSSLADRVNLITPIDAPDFIPPMQKVSLRAVVISAETERGDVYHSGQFLKDNERAISKVGILKLLQAAGGTVVSSERTDDRRDQYVCVYRVEIEVPQLDGRSRRFVASKTVDLRDGSPQAAPMKPAQLAQQRSALNEVAESKALLRAVRGALALKQKYTVTELSRPFVVPALVFDPDMSDPEIRRMVAAKGLGVAQQLYGGQPALPGHTAPGSMAPIDVTPQRELPAPVVLEDDDLEDFGAPEPAAAALCGCPCGDQAEVSPEVAARTLDEGGAVRCGACWPWNPKFNQSAHAGLADMGLPKHGKMTGAKAVAQNVSFLQKRGGKK